jgi:hypothetical protein
LSAVNPRELHLYSNFDGTCVLKVKGEVNTLDFADVLEALDFISAMPNIDGARLTVHDAQGNGMLHGPA